MATIKPKLTNEEIQRIANALNMYAISCSRAARSSKLQAVEAAQNHEAALTRQLINKVITGELDI